MPGTKPPITGTQHHLPYNSLSPVQFEELCLWLVQREGFERAEHLGAAGSEQGRDLVAWREDEQWVFQCKRVQTFTKALAFRELDKLVSELTSREIPLPKHYVFITSCLISAEIRDQVRQQYGEQFDLHFWAVTELDEKVSKHRDIKQQFFQIGAEPATVPHQIPSPPQDFVNRVGELKQLMREHTKGVRTFLIHSPGSFGKTTLAYAFARELEQYYPDGQIKVDLLGSKKQPLSVLNALGQVIHAFNPEQTIPADQPEAEDLYQSCLHGKQVLLLLDDAHDNDQVEALLPPTGCCLIVTSRLYLALPGCEELALTPLTPEQAIKPLPKTGTEAETDPDSSAIAEQASAVPPEGVRGGAMGPAAIQRPGLIERMRKVDANKIIGPVGPLGMIGLVIVIGVVFFFIYRLSQIDGLTPTPTIPVVTVVGTSTPTNTATVVMPVDTPTSTATFTPTSTDSPTPTHTRTPTPTYTNSPTPTSTTFPNLCFPIGTWEFESGSSEPLPTQSIRMPECYDAARWGFYPTHGIEINHESANSEIRGVRYPLPASESNIHADITLHETFIDTNEIVYLVIGLGDRPWDDDNRNQNEWFYILSDWGAGYLSQCVQYTTSYNCIQKTAIATLPNLSRQDSLQELNIILDIHIRDDRKVDLVIYIPQADGTQRSETIHIPKPLLTGRDWWLWVGYRTINGGDIYSDIRLYLTTPTPTPTP